jgi:hypothetical protein
MRTLLLISLVAFFLSCSKSDSTTEKTLADVFTGTIWQPNELRALEGNTMNYYKRGNTNTWNLDLEYVLFNADGTGTYADANGVTKTPITWNYTNTEKTSLQFIIAYSLPITINWENVSYKSSKLFYTQYLVRSNGTYSLASGSRTAK